MKSGRGLGGLKSGEVSRPPASSPAYTRTPRWSRRWSSEELAELARLHVQLGNKWAEVSSRMSGRTREEVKNIFYSTMRVHSPDDTPGRVFLRAYITALRACADDGEGARQASLRKAEKAASLCGETGPAGIKTEPEVIKAEGGGQGAACCDEGGGSEASLEVGGESGGAAERNRKRKGSKCNGDGGGQGRGRAVSSKRKRTADGGGGSRSSPRARGSKGCKIKQEAREGSGNEMLGPLLLGPSLGGAAEAAAVASPEEAPEGAELVAAVPVPSPPSLPRASVTAATAGPSRGAPDAALVAQAPSPPPAVTTAHPPPPSAQPLLLPPPPPIHASEPSAPRSPLLVPSPSLDSCWELLSDLSDWEEDSTPPPPPPPPSVPLQCLEPLPPPPSPPSPQSSPLSCPLRSSAAGAPLGSPVSSHSGVPEVPASEPQLSEAPQPQPQPRPDPSEPQPAPQPQPQFQRAPQPRRRASEAVAACGPCLLSVHFAAQQAAALAAVSVWPSPLPPHSGRRRFPEPLPPAPDSALWVSPGADGAGVSAATAAELDAMLEELAEAEAAASGTLLKLLPARRPAPAGADLFDGGSLAAPLSHPSFAGPRLGAGWWAGPRLGAGWWAPWAGVRIST